MTNKYLESLDKNKLNVDSVNNPIINNKLWNKNNYIYTRISSIRQNYDLDRQFIAWFISKL
jgi:predicted site-specific integrase-resolvase